MMVSPDSSLGRTTASGYRSRSVDWSPAGVDSPSVSAWLQAPTNVSSAAGLMISSGAMSGDAPYGDDAPPVAASSALCRADRRRWRPPMARTDRRTLTPPALDQLESGTGSTSAASVLGEA